MNFLTWNNVKRLLLEKYPSGLTNHEIAQELNANPIHTTHLTMIMHQAGEVERERRDSKSVSWRYYAKKEYATQGGAEIALKNTARALAFALMKAIEKKK